MPFNNTRTIDANEATRIAMAENRRMNGDSRYQPPILESVQRASDAARVFIFNVGPWPQERALGSAGRFFISAKPENAEYWGPLTIPGVQRELYPINEMEYKAIETEGWDFAMQIVGTGPFLSPFNSFVPYGVFASRTNPPKKEEVTEAKKALRARLLELVNEADVAFSKGPKATEDTIRPESHFVAARLLGKTEIDCPWLKNAQVPAERDECPGCGTIYKIGIMKCRECGYILDKDKYDKNKANFAA
jgi:hypothetical protein